MDQYLQTDKISKAKYIFIEQALNQIKQVCRDFNSNSPFFFLVGAGISYPSAPLAKDIIEHCQEKVKELNRKNPKEAEKISTEEQYSAWFELAYPNRYQRQNYLKEMLRNKPISGANIKLAHLLSAGVITNLVLTPNFDDFLSRALNIFSINHIVADHPHTVEKVNNDNNEIKLVHIHGTYWFYDCCNLKGEIVQRAKRSLQSNQTMSFFVDSILYRRTPIVVGYSGWENDVFMESLKRRLQSPLPCNLYWFCYQKSNISNLPDWLIDHQDVIFVVPDDTKQNYEDRGQSENSNVNLEIISNDLIINESVLDAQMVFEKFIEAFNIESPEIIRDPIKYFVKMLEHSGKGTNETEENNYFFKHAILRLNNAANSNEYNVNPKISELREHVRQSKYKDTILLAKEVYEESALLNSELTDILDILIACLEKAENNEQGYVLIRNIADHIISKETGYKELNVIREYVERAIIAQGKALRRTNQEEKAIRLFDDLINQNSDSKIFVNLLVEAYYYKSLCLYKLNRTEDALDTLDILIDEYDSHSDVIIMEYLSKAFKYKGIILSENNKPREAIDVLDTLVTKYSRIDSIPLREQAAGALLYKGVTLARELKDLPEAIKAFDEILAGYKENQGICAAATLNKCIIADESGDKETALKLLENLINETMNQIDEPQIKNYVMISHLKRAKIYRSLEQKNKAILEYGELLSKFSSSSKNNKHYLTAKIQRAILLFEEDQENEALSEINEVIDHHKNKKSIMMKTFVAKALYQKAIFVGKKGDLELAMQLYFEVHLTYKDEINVNIIEVVIMSLIGKAIAFETKGENNEAIQVYNEIDKQYHLVPERIIQKLVIKSMINKGNLLLHLERWGLAHEHFGEVVNRFNGKDEFKQSIITANIGIAIALKGLMKYKDSFDILNSINRSDIENSELIEELLNQYCDIGYLLTIEKNYHSAKIAFLNAFMDGNIFAGNNLSYLIRRYPDESDNFPNHELLLAEGLKINEPFSLVNRALLFIDENTNESWINASKCFSKINELESVIEWWHKLAANENDPEGHLVIGMLLINNPHHDPDGFSVQQRFSYVAHNYSFPEWLIASY